MTHKHKTKSNGGVSVTLGNKLLQLRKSRGLSQEQLAERLGVSRQAISRWELCEVLPDTDNLIKLSEMFSVTMDYMVKEQIESDGDLPIAKITEVKTKEQFRTLLLFRAGIVSSIVGTTGAFILWLLSRFIISGKLVERHFGTLIGEFGQDLPETESFTGYVYERARYGELGAFLDTYHLEVAFGIFCVLAIVGLIFLFFVWHKKAGRFNPLKRNNVSETLPKGDNSQ